MRKINLTNHSFRRIIRWIVSFIALAAFFFILPVSCDQMPAPGGGGSNGGDNGGTGGGDNGGTGGGICSATGTGAAEDPTADPDGDTVMNGSDVDNDNDGLIEIYNLDMFNRIRDNLDGTGYAGVPNPALASLGCPGGGCNGYELMANLDFAQGSSYASGAVNTTWCPDTSNNCIGGTSEAGFPGIGPASGGTGGFNANFEGNGHSISNFYSRNTSCTGLLNTECNIGLFRLTGSGASIRNLAVTNANVYGRDMSRDWLGGLVGRNGGIITASCTTGSADGETGFDNVGGLVGQSDGTITGGYSTASTNGGGGNDNVGGLVGQNSTNSDIIASYATGNADAGEGDDNVGGLVGLSSGDSGAFRTPRIIASHATGRADGEMGGDTVGGLVGTATVTDIIASYATGLANGGHGGEGQVGGLVGFATGTIIASFATGDANGGDQLNELVGGLVGESRGTITASYATGNANGGGGGADRLGGLAGFARGAITASYATGNANGGGVNDLVGGLVGRPSNNPTITESYSFGTVTSGIMGTDGDMRPTGVDSADDLTLTLAGASWNNAGNNTLGAWNFGSGSQDPAVVYNDYDDTAGTDYASCTSNNGGYPSTISGTRTNLTCGSTLVGGNSAQGR